MSAGMKEKIDPHLQARHFELIASILLECRNNPALKEFYDESSSFWHKLNMHFAVRLLKTNDKFDMDLFLRSAGSFTTSKEKMPKKSASKGTAANFSNQSPAQKRKELRKKLTELTRTRKAPQSACTINGSFIMPTRKKISYSP